MTQQRSPLKSLPRRTFLQLGAVAGAALVLPVNVGCGEDGFQDNELLEPGVLRPINGLLNVEMSVSEAQVTVGAYRFTSRVYSDVRIINGQGTYEVTPQAAGRGVPGPTLDVSPGDKIRLKLHNRLPPNRDHAHGEHPHNLPGQFNTTNLHTHGLHISPSGNRDNVLLEIEPGGSFEYEFEIPKGLPMPDGMPAADHPSGTYWYHPHRHGSTALQVMGGMAGALIVRNGPDELPRLGDGQERLLVIGELMLNVKGPSGDGLVNAEQASYTDIIQNKEDAAEFMHVNGQVNPVIRLRPNELQRWRLIHAGFHFPLNVALVRSDENTAEKFQALSADFQNFHQVALDGINFSRPKLITPPVEDTSNNPVPEGKRRPPVSPLVMAPGNRADLLVHFPQRGTYKLVTLGFNLGFTVARPQVLATVIVEGDSAERVAIPDSLVTPALYPPIRCQEVQHQRTLDFSVDVLDIPAGATPDDIHFNIGDKLFDPSKVDQCVPLGAVEEWTIRNVRLPSTDTSPHPFHIHVNSFMVTHINGVALPESEQVWQDTILLPVRGLNGASGPTDSTGPMGSITFRTRFLHFAGKYVLHCHMLQHEDLGMMQLVQVNEPSDPTQGDSAASCQLPPRSPTLTCAG